MADMALSPSQRVTGLGAVIFGSIGAGLTLGMLFPLASLTLEQRGVSAGLIGLNNAMQALAMLVLGPFLAAIVRRAGAVPALVGGTVAGAAAILALPVSPLVLWFGLRFVIGAGLALPWLVSETWINALARDAHRARVIGLYSVALFSGMALGPVLLQVLGREGAAPFVVCAGAILLAMFPLVLVRGLIPPLEIPEGTGVIYALRQAPTVFGAALLAGLSESACFMLLPVYGVRAGVGEPVALTWLTVLILGAIVLQFPLGWLADRFPYRRMLVVSAAAGTALPAAMYLTLSHPWLVWAVLFLLGGVVLGYYTIGLAQLGAHFRPGELAIANAAFMVMYEGGTTAGPVAVGAAMEAWHPHGFLAAMTVFALIFLVMLVRVGPTSAE